MTSRFVFLLLTALVTPPLLTAEAARPNVLFIAVDDLNDWVGCLGGHPQAETPHIDRLAARGVNFTNAHCQAPICNPSRVSLMTGRRPSTTGIYYLAPLLRDYEATRDLVTIPQHFAANGYRTLAAGKLLHGADKPEFDEYAGSFGGFGPRPPAPLAAGHTHPLWDWGPFPKRDEQMPDKRIADWAIEQLNQPTSQPFFLGVGFYRPHVPLYAPKGWFDRFPLEEVQLPVITPDDLADVPSYGQDLSWSRVAPRHRWMIENHQWRRAVQAYLASTAFVDHQIGRVLKALEQSSVARNTIVVLWSDHGFHLGVKERWGKRSLWEVSTRVVLVISGPGVASGESCAEPVGLIDLYPTLCGLCGLNPPAGLEGHTLEPQLANAAAPRPHPALTTFGRNNHAVRLRDWRYIEYADGTRELYDHRADPDEFNNLATDPAYADQIETMRRLLPTHNAPMAPGSKHADARPGSPADIDRETENTP
ncbi:MAG: sulfatase [Planctomycetota bacterium]